MQELLNKRRRGEKVNPRQRYLIKNQSIKSEVLIKKKQNVYQKGKTDNLKMVNQSISNFRSSIQAKRMANSRSVYEKVTTNNEESIDTKSRHTKHFRYNSSLSSKVPTQENRNYKTFKKIKQNLTFNEECFMEGVYALQNKFIGLCRIQHFNQAGEILMDLLNYAIDIQHLKLFFKLLKAIGNFYSICNIPEIALKFYRQLKLAAILQKSDEYVTYALIGLGSCCESSNLFEQGIKILKKALQYAWKSGKKQLQLLVYDEMGKKYYKMGNIDKATGYHSKFSNGYAEDPDSPLIALSTQKIDGKEEKNISDRYEKLNLLYLVHLFIPIKDTGILPLLKGILQTQTIRDQVKVKSQIPKQSSSYVDSIPYQIKKLLNDWMFEEEIQEPQMHTQDQALNTDKKNKSSPLYTFKLNRHLRMMGIKPILAQKKGQSVQKKVQYKMSMDQKIQRVMKQPSLSKDWYQKIVKQVQNDHKRKVQHVKSPVRLSKKNLSVSRQDQDEKYKNFYKKLYYIK